MIRKFLGSFRHDAEPPQPAGATPLRLAATAFAFELGVTRRDGTERRFGRGEPFPAPGWIAWTVVTGRPEPAVLAAFFRADGILVGVEHYVPKLGTVPPGLPAFRETLRLEPGRLTLAGPIAGLGPEFVEMEGAEGGARSVVYQHGYAARWPGGLALVGGNGGRIERIALYGDLPGAAR
jgi:hypothetical protein